jgi:hypothetical protein
MTPLSEPNEQASNDGKNRRHSKQGFTQPPPGFKLPDEVRSDGVSPAARLAEHLRSKAHRGPDAGGTVRVTMRNKLGGEKGAEAPLVRGLYDIANSKRKRRPRRRKEKES